MHEGWLDYTFARKHGIGYNKAFDAARVKPADHTEICVLAARTPPLKFECVMGDVQLDIR